MQGTERKGEAKSEEKQKKKERKIMIDRHYRHINYGSTRKDYYMQLNHLIRPQIQFQFF